MASSPETARLERRLEEVTAALDIAAHLPSAARCAAFVRAYVEGARWATDDVAKRIGRKLDA